MSLALDSASALLSRLGVCPKALAATPLTGGTNNQVYKIDPSEGPPLVLKTYASDARNRLTNEFAFLTYAWSVGIRSIPRPIACDSALQAALYSYLPGRPTRPEDATEEFLEQALSFYLQLNATRGMGSHLANASDSAFSVEEAIRNVQHRIDRLAGVQDVGCRAYFQEEILPLWLSILRWLGGKSGQGNNTLSLPLEARALSPSDFGLHNALVAPDGRFSFIDFEYAGWDDPAKTIADFFTQPKSRPPLASMRAFAEQAERSLSASHLLDRIALLFPVCQMKWACIFLNAFLKGSGGESHLRKASEYLKQFHYEAF